MHPLVVGLQTDSSFTGVFEPEGSLSDLDSLEMNGGWELMVTDDAKKKTGTIVDLVVRFAKRPK